MPVDHAGLLIALALWVVGTVWAYRRIRAALLARHDASIHGPLPSVPSSGRCWFRSPSRSSASSSCGATIGSAAWHDIATPRLRPTSAPPPRPPLARVAVLALAPLDRPGLMAALQRPDPVDRRREPRQRVGPQVPDRPDHGRHGVGADDRGDQPGLSGCCLDFSLALIPVCGGALFGGLVVQLVVPPRGTWSRVCRLLAWSAGLFVWFGGGIVSFGHALS